MGFFNWFSNSPKPAAANTSGGHSSFGSESTRPYVKGQTMAQPTTSSVNRSAPAPGNVAANESASRLTQRRTERNARRELLFQVVRESMVRVGVLSSGYKFKVLALDQRGRTFLVMIDLAAEFGGETEKLSEIEALVSRSAKSRYEIIVQAVYWRFNETVVTQPTGFRTASAPAPLSGQPMAVPSRPAPLSAMPSHVSAYNSAFTPAHPPAPIQQPAPKPGRPAVTAPVPLSAQAYPAPAASRAQPVLHTAAPGQTAFEPIASDEVEAFRRALASGAQLGIAAAALGSAAKAAPAAAHHLAGMAASDTAYANTIKMQRSPSMEAIQNKLLLTGYEETEMPDPDAPMPDLSGTQYGDLH